MFMTFENTIDTILTGMPAVRPQCCESQFEEAAYVHEKKNMKTEDLLQLLTGQNKNGGDKRQGFCTTQSPASTPNA